MRPKVSVNELGYLPAPSETSLTYRVCSVDDATGVPKACAQSVVYGTTDQCLPHVYWIDRKHGPVAGGNNIQVEGDGFEDCPQFGPPSNMQVFFQHVDPATQVLTSVQAAKVDCRDSGMFYVTSPAVAVPGPWDIVVTAYGKTSPRTPDDVFTYASGPELENFTFAWQSGTAVGTVWLDGTAPADITVSLASDDPSSIAVPPTAMVPAGSNSVSFPMPGPDNVSGTWVDATRDGYMVSAFVTPPPPSCGPPKACRTNYTWDDSKCACVFVGNCMAHQCM